MIEQSPEAGHVIAAFVKASAAMSEVKKNAKVSAGPMRYSYADLGAVLEAVRPHLAANGLALSQYADDSGVSTVLFHESGEWLRYPPLQIAPDGARAQQVGSAISYAKRYQILSVFGLATDDDDGREADAPPAQPRKKAASTVSRDVKRLQIAFNDAGIVAREDRLTFCIETIGHVIGSSKDLTPEEIKQVLKALTARTAQQ